MVGAAPQAGQSDRLPRSLIWWNRQPVASNSKSRFAQGAPSDGPTSSFKTCTQTRPTESVAAVSAAVWRPPNETQRKNGEVGFYLKRFQTADDPWDHAEYLQHGMRVM